MSLNLPYSFYEKGLSSSTPTEWSSTSNFPATPGAYIINQNNMGGFPIYGSMNLNDLGLANKDDHIMVLPGYGLIVTNQSGYDYNSSNVIFAANNVAGGNFYVTPQANYTHTSTNPMGTGMLIAKYIYPDTADIVWLYYNSNIMPQAYTSSLFPSNVSPPPTTFPTSF